MNKYHTINMDTWERRQIFDFFTNFDIPTFNVTVPIDASRLYQCAKDTDRSFFLLSLYAILRASNEVPQARQRILADKCSVAEFSHIAAMTPVMTPAETFCQVWCEYRPTYTLFAESVGPHIAAARQGVSNLPGKHDDGFVCASCSPWFHFTSLTQVSWKFAESIPSLAWGKIVDGIVPIAGKFHHGLWDGLHVGRFFSSIERSFSVPENLESEIPIQAQK